MTDPDIIEYPADEPFPGVIGRTLARHESAVHRRRAGRRVRTAVHHPEPLRTRGIQLRLRRVRLGRPDLFTAPFRFTGTIHRLVIDISGDLVQHDEAELRRVMTQQ